MSFANSVSLSPFQFFTLSQFARTCTAKLNKSGESGQPCLAPSSVERLQPVQPDVMFLCYCTQPLLHWSALLLLCRMCAEGCFYHVGMLNFIKCFFYIF